MKHTCSCRSPETFGLPVSAWLNLFGGEMISPRMSKVICVASGMAWMSLALAVADETVSPLSPVREVPAWARACREELPTNQQPLRQFYVDRKSGNDGQDGQTPATAWKTLARVNRLQLRPGDHILLRRGCRFAETLTLNGATGSAGAYVRIGAFGPETDAKPVIDGKGQPAAVRLKDCQYVQIEDLEITNDHGEPVPVTGELLALAKVKEEKKWQHKLACSGVEITVGEGGATRNIYLNNLSIHDVFPARSSPSEGKINSTCYGYGVQIDIPNEVSGTISNVVIQGCRIANTGHFGILTSAGRKTAIKNVIALDNRMDRTGGSGLLLAQAKNAYVEGNIINRSGSFDDGRKHGRGSGSWTFASENVLYENNVFMNALGKGDSTGVHIDFNCRDVVVQRNLSINNEGGFMEVLGNNYNCAYRYNISINDGSRVKGRDGAAQEGKVLMVSGHCMQAPYGPFNSYFYNNTIYAKPGINPKFAITHSADGLLIANNIFYLLADGSQVNDDQPTANKAKRKPEEPPRNVVFKNNLYNRATLLPPDLNIQDAHKIIADPRYRNPGGLDPADYTPQNRPAVQDAGMVIPRLPGDSTGLIGGDLQVNRDFLGNPIVGHPDIGAIELSK
jgi:hypothetical protein